MLVKELMTPVVNCVKPEASVTETALQMKKENVGAIPVCNDKGELLGIITDRDIALRAVASENYGCAKDIMSTNIITASPHMNTHDAALLMSKYQLRRLPVATAGRLIGILSLADIARLTSSIDEAGDILSAVSRPARIF